MARSRPEKTLWGEAAALHCTSLCLAGGTLMSVCFERSRGARGQGAGLQGQLLGRPRLRIREFDTGPRNLNKDLSQILK